MPSYDGLPPADGRDSDHAQPLPVDDGTFLTAGDRMGMVEDGQGFSRVQIPEPDLIALRRTLIADLVRTGVDEGEVADRVAGFTVEQIEAVYSAVAAG